MKYKFSLFILFACVALASVAYHFTARSVAEAGKPMAVAEKRILHIDRSQPFNPATCIGGGWTIWKGPADGTGLTGEEEQDACSLALTELDPTKIRLEKGFAEGEEFIPGNERLRRLKAAGRIRLDAKVFQALWENQNLIPESWKGMNGHTRFIFFDGTVLRSPRGDRCVLSLYWNEGGWHCNRNWLGDGRSSDSPSAVLAEPR